MTSEKVVEQIEKLIDEKLRVVTMLASQNFGGNKEFFLGESRHKIEVIKGALLEALQDERH